MAELPRRVSDPVETPREARKTRMVPMAEDGENWVDLGAGPMVITAIKGDCVFGTGDVAPDYSSDGGLPIPAQVAVFLYTDLHVWARLAPDIVEGEVIVGPL